jgi:hypothetical protein
MNGKSMRRWFGSGVLGLAVLSGCNSMNRRHELAATSPVQAAAAKPRTPTGDVAAVSHTSTAADGPASPYAGFPDQATKAMASVPEQQTPALVPMPAVAQANHVEPQPMEPGPAPVGTDPANQAAAEQPPAGLPRSEPPPPRRSYVDATAAPCFGRAPDYSWLSGQVEYSRLGRGWRLRYSSVDDVDHYGGSVTLIEDQDLSGLTDGQYVTVRGHLSNPNDPGPAPAYRVESFQHIDHPNSASQPAGGN